MPIFFIYSQIQNQFLHFFFLKFKDSILYIHLGSQFKINFKYQLIKIIKNKNFTRKSVKDF